MLEAILGWFLTEDRVANCLLNGLKKAVASGNKDKIRKYAELGESAMGFGRVVCSTIKDCEVTAAEENTLMPYARAFAKKIVAVFKK